MLKRFILSFFLFFTLGLYAQQVKVTNDFGIWGGLLLEKNISENFKLNLEQQIRTYSNASKLDDYLAELSLQYKINKNFNLSSGIRYVYNEKRWKETENNIRYNIDFGFKQKISSRFKFYYRLKYQKEYVNLLSNYSIEKIHFSDIRNKIKLAYKANDLNKIYVSAEVFRLIEKYKAPYYNKLRFYLGDKVDTKIGQFDCSIGYEHEIQTEYPYSFLFLKTIYKIKL